MIIKAFNIVWLLVISLFIAAAILVTIKFKNSILMLLTAVIYVLIKKKIKQLIVYYSGTYSSLQFATEIRLYVAHLFCHIEI
jgi:hypothetical protein